LNNSEKFLIRKSILELARTGMPRSNSIDDDIRHNNQNKNSYEIVNLWDYVTALGAQLSRPAYDPYRETINLDTSIGRSSSCKVNLTIPLLIYENMSFSNNILEAIHRTLNRLAEEGNVLGFISEDEIKNTTTNKRKYPWFKKISSNATSNQLKSYQNDSPQGIVLEYGDHNSIELLKNLRKEFEYPILVDISKIFPNYINEILNTGIDGIIVDTEKVKKRNEIYKTKHAIAVIRDTRNTLNEYSKMANKKNGSNSHHDCYNNNDIKCCHVTHEVTLVIAGDVNTTGKIIKSVALGADIIGYSTSMLIAYSEIFSDRIFEIEFITERVYRHMIATKEEIKGIPAALGYSNFHNLTPSDLRTSSIEASLQGDILLEGVDKTYYQIIDGILDEYIEENGIQISLEERKKILESLVGH
jgi:Conserved region in glutamate synthase